MICNNCKKEIENNASFCPSCGEKISEENKVITPQDDKGLVTPLKPKVERIKLDIFGVTIPIVYISIFCVILGYGGYITPLLLLAGVLLLAKTECKTLTSNFFVVLALYAAQFTIETVLTFIASIPTQFFGWLGEMGSSNIDFVATMANISSGFSNVFGIISNVIGLCFFAMYILCIVSLFKSDKIRIPFVTDIVKKYLIQ